MGAIRCRYFYLTFSGGKCLLDNEWIGPIGPIVTQKAFLAGLIFRGSLFLQGLVGGSFAFQNADWA